VTRVLLVAFALMVAACGGIPKTAPTHIVALAQDYNGEQFLLLVYDGSGLVTSIASSDAPHAASDAQAIADPAKDEIALTWIGGACAHSPKLGVKGDATALTLELDVSPFDFSLVPQDCPAIGLFFAVTLTLAQPVEQQALTLTLLSR
jgi:hypothetical protein